MDKTLVLWIVVVAALLVIEWRRKWPLVRVVLVFMALFQLWFGQPVPYRALRSVINLPPDQRVTIQAPDTVRLDDYRSGVLTMARAVQWEVDGGSRDRMIAVAVLVWLAISPIIPRRSLGVAKPTTGTDGAAA